MLGNPRGLKTYYQGYERLCKERQDSKKRQESEGSDYCEGCCSLSGSAHLQFEGQTKTNYSPWLVGIDSIVSDKLTFFLAENGELYLILSGASSSLDARGLEKRGMSGDENTRRRNKDFIW